MHLDWRLRLASPLHTQEGSTVRAWQASRRSRCWRQRRPAGNHKLRKWQHVVTVRPRPVCRHVRRRAHILGRTLRPRNGKGEASEDEEEVEPNCKDMMTRSCLFVPLTHASFPILDLRGPHFNDLEVLNRSRWSFFFSEFTPCSHFQVSGSVWWKFSPVRFTFSSTNIPPHCSHSPHFSPFWHFGAVRIGVVSFTIFCFQASHNCAPKNWGDFCSSFFLASSCKKGRGKNTHQCPLVYSLRVPWDHLRKPAKKTKTKKTRSEPEKRIIECIETKPLILWLACRGRSILSTLFSAINISHLWSC